MANPRGCFNSATEIHVTKFSRLIVFLATAPAVMVLAAAGPDPLPRARPQDVGLSATSLDEATALLARVVKEEKIAGAVAGVARHGKLAYLQAVGSQDLATRAPMTDRSLFRIYSMTKS